MSNATQTDIELSNELVEAVKKATELIAIKMRSKGLNNDYYHQLLRAYRELSELKTFH